MRFAADENNTKITGRTIYRDGVRYLGYTGSSVSFRFKGKTAKVELVSDASTHEKRDYAWVAVFVKEEKDNEISYGAAADEEPYKRFCLDKDEAEYVLYESDEEKTVTVTLIKYSEAEYAACGIKWIETDSEEILTPPAAKKLKMIRLPADMAMRVELKRHSMILQKKIRWEHIHFLRQHILMRM